MAKQGIEYLQSNDKRNLDVAGSIALAGMFLPVGAGIGLAAAVDTQSVNPLFLQERVGGKGEQSFTAWKFRTLSNYAGAQAVSRTFGTFDPRASRWGQLTRQAGLDELPQLVNIFRGDMSLVGPRPLSLEALERNEAADSRLFEQWYSYFKTVKPGLTGKSQLYSHNYRHVTDDVIAESMRLDLDYFESASLGQDIRLLVSTPASLMRANLTIVENGLETVADGQRA